MTEVRLGGQSLPSELQSGPSRNWRHSDVTTAAQFIDGGSRLETLLGNSREILRCETHDTGNEPSIVMMSRL